MWGTINGLQKGSSKKVIFQWGLGKFGVQTSQCGDSKYWETQEDNGATHSSIFVDSVYAHTEINTRPWRRWEGGGGSPKKQEKVYLFKLNGVGGERGKDITLEALAARNITPAQTRLSKRKALAYKPQNSRWMRYQGWLTRMPTMSLKSCIFLSASFYSGSLL